MKQLDCNTVQFIIRSLQDELQVRDRQHFLLSKLEVESTTQKTALLGSLGIMAHNQESKLN